MRRLRRASAPVAEMVYVVNIFNVRDPSLREELEAAADEEAGSYHFFETASGKPSYEFWFNELDNAGRFLRVVKELGIKVRD